MSTHGRTALIVALALVGIAGLSAFCWFVSSEMPLFLTTAAKEAQPAGSRIQHPIMLRRHAGPAFTPDEVHAFLAKVRSAETVADPLQRCLSYPDPPRSHWSPAAVEAYCQYHLHKTLSFDEARALIQSGHAAELDRQLAQVLQAQLTRPDSHGFLDHTYFAAFEDGSLDVRETLDAWKRASPSSAFAYAASGTAYVAMAWKARGADYISETPQSNIDAMDRLLERADTDLQRAMALNPQITPTYVAMIYAGSMSLGSGYMRRAARLGLAAAPDNYAIYGMLSHAAEPRWGGSLAAMDRVAQQAQAHIKQNPLLAIVLAAGPAYRYDVCNCESSVDWSAYPTVFDNVASTALLGSAGKTASENGHPDLAVVYLSEVMRFLPGALDTRRQRDSNLVSVDESQMALDDANRLIAANPMDPSNYQLRGTVYMMRGDSPNAEKDLEHALAMDPDNIDVLGPLGSLYMDQTHEWDKAWDITDRIIRKYPGSPAGWVMRATIQETQPRAGLEDTYQYFVRQFGNDPSMQWQINHMRELLAKSPQKVVAGPAPKSH
ncbi:DUF4034 domain-containing protein [Rhodanobacter sp. DHG33]|uniref:DUF4034 domain-containing protein n=1 Tax=Rhodanobacter sp. DHG33 TaxID=2775921 RepID=UPI0017811E6F|nr:DUF4034 domain-containing protein [Rhodanobacter sp. DHG33]MBD8900205.1 DUF4034 domain-containing protein [Rhodanobacter sp. DHG33]